MGRLRKAWLWGRDGKRTVRGRVLPGNYVRFYDYTPEGVRINHSKRFPNLQEAQSWMSRFDLHLQQEKIDLGNQPRMSDCVVAFLDSKHLAPDTRGSYKTALGWLTELTKNAPLSRISGKDIDRFIQKRLALSSEATVAKHLRSLNVFFRWAIATGHLQTNPLERSSYKLQTVTKRQVPDITEADVVRLLKHIPDADPILAICLAMTSGLSRKQITELASTNIDINKRCFRFLNCKQSGDTCISIHHLLFPLLAKRLTPHCPHARILKDIERHRIKQHDWWRIATTETGLEGLRFRDVYSWAKLNEHSIDRILKSRKLK